MRKRLAMLFSESYQEFKKIETITTAAMIGAISVILGYFTLEVGSYLRIGFSGVSNQLVYYLFGPTVGGLFGGAIDLLKFLIKPTGEFFPGYTLGAMIAGVLYGCFFYKSKLTFLRVLLAELTVSMVSNVLLGTLWLHLLYGKGFLILLPTRVVKNLVMAPVNALLFYTIAKALEASGVFQLLRKKEGTRR